MRRRWYHKRVSEIANTYSFCSPKRPEKNAIPPFANLMFKSMKPLPFCGVCDVLMFNQ